MLALYSRIWVKISAMLLNDKQTEDISYKKKYKLSIF